MDVSHIIDSLNLAQRNAVTTAIKPTLVLAGAGSGKTRVLVHRIAWLVQVEGVSPYGILAVTFTNKAAGEMRTRIESLLQIPAQGLWIGTFHGIAHRLLRMHWQEARLPQTFQILDADDQFRVIKRVIRSLELDDARWPPRQAQWYINQMKDEGLRAKQVTTNNDPFQVQMQRIYQAYEETCQRSGMVDFAELLLRAYEIWDHHPELLAQYQQRFQQVLVDEFQDTNSIQYAWLCKLVGQTGKLFVVGDDDQSIYGWRGAKVENIRQFSSDFPGSETWRLEQNYRSTGVILSAANALIAHNDNRLGKELWTDGADGNLISLYAAYNEFDEARFVVDKIKQWCERGNPRVSVAVLYRSNAQSRLLEEAFLNAGMPYRIYGGLRFFDRQEIKDALAYLRLAQNPMDDAAFERVINTPARGIGSRTIDILRDLAKTHQVPLLEACALAEENASLAGRALLAVKGFLQLLDDIKKEIALLSLEQQVEQAIQASGLIAHYQKEKGEKGHARIENLEELVNAARQFEPYQHEESPLPPLGTFIAHAALEAGEAQADVWEDSVQLMTLHSAKGLEFPLVILCGMEDGLFPHQMSAKEPERLQEERRLCYVGVTRAKEQLILTYAEKRRLHGTDTHPHPSRFLQEIPAELIEEVRPRVQVTRPAFQSAQACTSTLESEGYHLGRGVSHGKFGEGVITHFEGSGAQARVQVNFKQAGSKWLVISYANLSLL